MSQFFPRWSLSREIPPPNESYYKMWKSSVHRTASLMSLWWAAITEKSLVIIIPLKYTNMCNLCYKNVILICPFKAEVTDSAYDPALTQTPFSSLTCFFNSSSGHDSWKRVQHASGAPVTSLHVTVLSKSAEHRGLGKWSLAHSVFLWWIIDPVRQLASPLNSSHWQKAERVSGKKKKKSRTWRVITMKMLTVLQIIRGMLTNL